MLRKILIGLLAIVILAAVGIWIWWPKNLVVNGPVLDFITGRQADTPAEKTVESRFKLPDGFKIGIFAADVPHARMMRVTEAGDILVTSMREGNVYLLHRDEDGDGKSDGRTLLFFGLNVPHGLALHDGYIYVAETDRILRARFNPETRIAGSLELVFSGLPAGGNHRTRTIDFGPDGMLYVTTGSSCNVCIETEQYRATMLRMTPDGENAQVFATGLRNTVGFDWQPGTGVLYGTDNGRDLLGDDTPHCELNRIEEGADYGWPYAYDDQVPDPDFGKGNEDKVKASRPLAHGFGAHVAPLGIRFLDPKLAPEGYGDVALVALHGSWNRSTLSGYKVVALHISEDGDIEEEDFLTGFEKDEDVIGRPVDVAQGPDGSIYVSDDYAGVIYRIGFGDIAVDTDTIKAEAEPAPQSLEGEGIEEAAAQGAILYADHSCASCHDPAMAPEGTQAKVLKDLGARYDVESLMALLATPPSPMPKPDLTDEERRAVAVYLLTREDTE
ncbi:PQQ-dependent sugar dehydrogenase [Kordiimonas gwangyangensis]|uniref:PQQ-dependent sugar dehydrogenase n=1 Tax=Kordiimonas gwangyangensis TaxID=288022 RepID=UPI00037E84B3|nr:PQQ-dependent sugar dehydrogenase [Kordiimonas gwangyangensis]